MENTTINFNEYFTIFSTMFHNTSPFNKIIKMRLENMNGSIGVKIDMREELIGNYKRKILHGGVISSVMDVAGGVTALASIIPKKGDIPLDKFQERCFRLATINLRIDYLSPGKGDFFLATGSILRYGEIVSLVNIKLHNNFDQLIAVGIGTYMVA
ncbi:MAG: thioesterase family protein [Desulfosarcina sp.]|nr:thioesterase family protein [Desulfobacterales bacterium]